MSVFFQGEIWKQTTAQHAIALHSGQNALTFTFQTSHWENAFLTWRILFKVTCRPASLFNQDALGVRRAQVYATWRVSFLKIVAIIELLTSF